MQSGSAAIERIDQLLEVLATDGPMTLTQLAEATGLPRATTHRLLMRIVQLRWATRRGTRYELGVRLFGFGSEAIRSHWFHELALPHLDELQRSTGHVVHLAYLDGHEVVYWGKLWGTYGVKIPTRIGGRQGAHRTALGKALLAEQADFYIESKEFDTLHKSTPRTISTRTDLGAAIKSIRAEGIAFDHGEALVGLGCIATSVTASSADSTITAAISLCGPESGIHSNRKLISSIREAAVNITRGASNVATS